jgi:hypothetical protein
LHSKVVFGLVCDEKERHVEERKESGMESIDA